jgi:lipopolysaccharide transport system ATP-binding protein
LFIADSQTSEFWIGPCDNFQGNFGFRTPWLKPGDYRVQMRICNAGVLDNVEYAAVLRVADIFPSPKRGNLDGAVLPDFTYSQQE